MIQLPETKLPAPASTILGQYQAAIDIIGSYSAKVAAAKMQFRARNIRDNPTFATIRTTLSSMCSGAQRCCYCEDSAADEVEHVCPKDIYPEAVFVWENYLYACGPCNGPKSNQYAIFDGATGAITNVSRKAKAPVVPPPVGEHVLINPRRENPLKFLVLDLIDTFEFVPVYNLSEKDKQRAIYTRKVLRLNERDLLVQARKSAYASYVARLKEYISERDSGASEATLLRFVKGIQGMHHPTVWKEMQRQHAHIPELNQLFEAAPEAMGW